MTAPTACPGRILDRVNYVAAWITIPLAVTTVAIVAGQPIAARLVPIALDLPFAPKIALRAEMHRLHVPFGEAEARR